MAKEIPDVPDDDESHPISHLTKIDVATWLKNGGYYGIVVDRPMTDDTVSRARILKKLTNYMEDFYSEEFRKRHGSPLPGKLKIYVALHPHTDTGILSFLEDCRPWLADNKVELVLRYLDPQEGDPMDATRIFH
jgi:hypothetical protein